MWLVLAANVCYSVGAFLLCSRLIEGMGAMFVRAKLFGRDLNKDSDEKV